MLITGSISSLRQGKVQGGPSSAEGDRAIDRTRDKLHHGSEGSTQKNNYLQCRSWAKPGAGPEAGATYNIAQAGNKSPRLNLKGAPGCMGCRWRWQARLFKAIMAYYWPQCPHTGFLCFGVTDSICSKPCQNTNTTHIVPVLASLEVQWAPGHAAMPMLVREGSSTAMFSGSRRKSTQDSHRDLCYRKIWVKILRLVWCSVTPSVINGLQIALSCAGAKTSSKHNLS